MIFDIDANMVLNSILESLEVAAADASSEQLANIVNDIDDSLPGVIQVLAQGMTENWRDQARKAGGWGTKYAQAIMYRVTGTSAEIYIDENLIDPESNKPFHMFAMMMEKGVKSWSIKDALLKSEKAKVSADGIKYIVVPFPVATPRRKGQGKRKSKYGRREMTRDMHRIVKSGGKLKPGTTIKAGERDVDVTGLTRFGTKKFHEQYGIFRVVTQNSKGWVHPGRGPEPVYPKVLQEVNRRISEMLFEFCKDVVRKYSE